MTTDPTHREQLSALMDGALDADQARFLSRRLQHDGGLSALMQRWQMAGDALRGQAQAPAPAGFAEAVAARICGEPMPMPDTGFAAEAGPDSGTAPRAQRLRVSRIGWFSGGALAASLTIAALIALRPPAASESSVPVAAASTATPARAASRPEPSPAVEMPAPEAVVASASERPVPSSIPAAAAYRRSRPAPEPAVAHGQREQEPAVLAQKTVPAADPFRQPSSPSWPRALVPIAADAGGFNVRYDVSPASDPFQPREIDLPAAGEP